MSEHKHRFIYSTHKEPLEAPKADMKVSELKAIIGKHVEGFNPDYTLVLEEHGDRPDKPLNNNDDVRIHETPHLLQPAARELRALTSVNQLAPVTKLTPKALADFEALKERHPSATLRELPSGAALVTLDCDLPQGWSAPKIVLRFIMPNGYGVAPPDGFWVEPNLQVNGNVPRASSPNNEIPEAGIVAHRFSWHFDGGHWSPNRDNLITWLRSCRERFEKIE